MKYWTGEGQAKPYNQLPSTPAAVYSTHPTFKSQLED